MYDIIIDTPDSHYPLFSAPRLPVADPEHMIGMHVATLIRDGGTLQIGIGALGDAIAHALHLRHNQNASFKELVLDAGIAAEYASLIKDIGGTEAFEEGLYGATEMLVDGFLQLYKSGVIKRRVYHHVAIQSLINQGKLRDAIPGDVLDLIVADEAINPYLVRKDFETLQHYGVFKDGLVYDDGHIVDGYQRHSANLADAADRRKLSKNCLGSALRNGVVLTGGFFIGPSDFYDSLRNMPDEERRLFEMTGVDVANQLYGDRNAALPGAQTGPLLQHRHEGHACWEPSSRTDWRTAR